MWYRLREGFLDGITLFLWSVFIFLLIVAVGTRLILNMAVAWAHTFSLLGIR